MITINIKVEEMEHIKDESHYNYNFYRCGNMGVKLLQICNEEYDDYDYYLVEGDKKIFLGSADHFKDEIFFLHKWT